MCKCKRDCVYVGSAVDSSLHSEAAGFLHSRQQFLVKFLVRLVGRDVYPVKTRVGLGQVVCVGVYQMDGEEPWSCRTCRTLHTYILVITALLWYTEHSSVFR